MIFCVLIEREVVEVARRERLKIFRKLGVLLDVFDLIARYRHDVKRSIFEGGQRVIGRGNDLILEIIESNLRGVPIGLVFLELNVGGAGYVFAQHERAVGEEGIGASAVAVVEFFVNRIESRECHQRKEERYGRVEFDDKSLFVGCGYSQRLGVCAFDDSISVFDTSNRIAHDVSIFLRLLAMTSPCEDKILSRDRIAVRPFCVAQVERVSLAVLGYVDAFGKCGNRFALGVELH